MAIESGDRNEAAIASGTTLRKGDPEDRFRYGGGDDAMEHVPESARGVYGELTPERLARLRAHLLHGLGGEPRRRR